MKGLLAGFRRLSPAAKRGLLTHLLQWQALQIGSLYVGVYLFKLGHGFRLPAWYALWNYVGVPIGYWLAANGTRRWGPGASLRLGLVAFALTQGLILALGGQAGDWAMPLGLMWGLGIGLYWQAWVLLIVDLSDEGSDRDLMLGANQASYFVASLTGAPLAGLYLAWAGGTRGYPVVFGTGLALFLASWLVSLPLRGKPQHGASALGRLIKARKPVGWTPGLITSFLAGVLSVGAMFLPLLMSVDMGGNERQGGGYTALNAVAGLLASLAVTRLGHPERRQGFIFWSALAAAALTLPLVFVRSWDLVLVYGLGMAVVQSLFNVPVFAAQISIIESSPRFLHRRADAMLLREIPLNVGRCCACAVVLWGVSDSRSPAMTALLFVLAVAPLTSYALLRQRLKAP